MYANWNILEPVYRTINISISNDETIQIKDVKENHDPLIFTYQVEESNIQQFFEVIKMNLGGKTTYDSTYVGGWNRSFTLYCENGNIFKYHSDYCTDIVKELLTKCQIII